MMSGDAPLKERATRSQKSKIRQYLRAWVSHGMKLCVARSVVKIRTCSFSEEFKMRYILLGIADRLNFRVCADCGASSRWLQL